MSRFGIEYNGKSLGEFSLHVPGTHNVLNATAAVAVGIGLDIPVYSIQYALETFRGVDRRFQTKGEVVDIVTGVTRGTTCTRVRLNTLAKVLNKHLAEINAREEREAAQASARKKKK